MGIIMLAALLVRTQRTKQTAVACNGPPRLQIYEYVHLVGDEKWHRLPLDQDQDYLVQGSMGLLCVDL